MSKTVHPSLSKDMKGPVQIKRWMLYINANLSKNQLYKLNKQSPYHQQDDIESFSNYFCKSFYYCLQFTFVFS